jgi:prolyl oligopeptidase
MTRTTASIESSSASVREVLHGVEIEDRFRWLEDQDSPATRAYIDGERTIYKEYLHNQSVLRGSIEARVRELLTVEIADLPVPDELGGLLYLKREPHQEQKAIYHKIADGNEQVLVSCDTLRRDEHTSLAIADVSPNGRYLVIGIRAGGDDAQEIRIYDLATSCLLSDDLPRGALRGIAFDELGLGFYYAHEEITGPYRTRRAVRHHVFGRQRDCDEEVFYGGDGPHIRLLVQRSEDNSSLGYTIVTLDGELRTRFLVQDLPLREPPKEIVDLRGCIAARISARTVEAFTTLEAPLGRLVSFSPVRSDPKSWRTLIPETNKRIYGYQSYGELIIVHYLEGTDKSTHIYSHSGELLRTIEYPRVGTTLVGQVDPAHDRLFYSYSDTSVPPAIYEVDLKTGSRTLWWEQVVPSFNRNAEVKKGTYRSSDGVDVPFTLVCRKGQSGPGPALLSAYGAGGVSSTSKFSVLVTILLEAGFTSVVAHVRGGGEGGGEWHRAAQKQSKQKSVDDFISAAHWMIAQRITTTAQLGIAGQSHGALLTLCAYVQQPDLFRAAMALGPIADLTRFHLFGVAQGFTDEFGSPENPEEFLALYNLSPYHHIRNQILYPSILVISGDRDRRCDSLHARKMIARLREASPPESLILLDYTEQRGHKPVLSLTERIQSLADRLTFLIAELSAVCSPGGMS